MGEASEASSANIIDRRGLGVLLRGGVVRFGAGSPISVDVTFAADLTPDVILAELAALLKEAEPDVVPLAGG